MVVELKGVIESRASEAILGELNPVICSGARVLLDVAEVRSLSSVGLRALVSIGQRLRRAQGILVLCGLRDDLIDLIWSVGFDEQFELCDSVEEGLELLKR